LANISVSQADKQAGIFDGLRRRISDLARAQAAISLHSFPRRRNFSDGGYM